MEAMKTFLLLLLVCLVGCTTTPFVVQKPIKPYIPPLPARLELEVVEWKVMMLPEMGADGEITTNKIPYFVLDTKNYENLSRNTILTSAYLQKLRVVIYSLQETNIPVNSLLPNGF
jgi:hypothetical protein